MRIIIEDVLNDTVEVLNEDLDSVITAQYYDYTEQDGREYIEVKITLRLREGLGDGQDTEAAENCCASEPDGLPPGYFTRGEGAPHYGPDLNNRRGPAGSGFDPRAFMLAYGTRTE